MQGDSGAIALNKKEQNRQRLAARFCDTLISKISAAKSAPEIFEVVPPPPVFHLYAKRLLFSALGILPFIIWEIFSVIYYGFPFPNTAYAKLGTTIPLIDYLSRGGSYIVISFIFSPFIVFIPIAAIVANFFSDKRIKYISVSIGLFIYLCYLVYVGGDFMAGRHLVSPFFLSLFVLNDLYSRRQDIVQKTFKHKVLIVLTALFCLQYVPVPLFGQFNLSSESKYKRNTFIIVDERSNYFINTSLIAELLSVSWNAALIKYKNSNGKKKTMNETWDMRFIQRKDFKEALEFFKQNSYAGRASFNDERNKYIYDQYALGDPFLIHIPPLYNRHWRSGHISRILPNGYQLSVQKGQNLLENPSLREFYDKILLIVRGKDLFAKERLQTILKMNLHKYDYLIEEYKQSGEYKKARG